VFEKLLKKDATGLLGLFPGKAQPFGKLVVRSIGSPGDKRIAWIKKIASGLPGGERVMEREISGMAIDGDR
jgi:hypothetical protein